MESLLKQAHSCGMVSAFRQRRLVWGQLSDTENLTVRSLTASVGRGKEGQTDSQMISSELLFSSETQRNGLRIETSFAQWMDGWTERRNVEV